MKLALNKINELTAADGQQVIRAKLRGLLRGYIARWGAQTYDVLEIEALTTAPLLNPGTSCRSRSFTVAGKKDLLLIEDQRLWLMDHKTTSEDIEDPNSSYWRQLIVEGQHHHYSLLEFENGRRVDGCIWDVVKKPGIAPKQITKADQAQLLSTRTYFGDAVSDEDAAAVRADGRETPALYEARLAYDCSTIRPEWYFQRRRIARLDAAMLEYAGELWQHSQDLLWARREKSYPRNSGACILYGGACEYLGICSGYDAPESDNWIKREWVHPELPVLDNGDGRDILTNSRIRCFQTCRRKHYYRYELGITRADSEEREALFFGHIWHEALATWFEGYRKDSNNGNASSDEPASAVGCATEG